MTSTTTLRSQWDVTDADTRRQASNAVLSAVCTYTDPTVHADGPEAIIEYMTGFQANVPGGHFVTRSFVEHHDRSLAHWDMALGDGTVVGTGTSFATFGTDGKLTSMTGFFDPSTDS